SNLQRPAESRSKWPLKIPIVHAQFEWRREQPIRRRREIEFRRATRAERKIDSSSPALLSLFLAAEPNGRTSAHLPLGHFRIFLSHHSCFQQQLKLNCFASISFPQLTPNDGAVLVAIARLLAGFGQ